MWICIRLRLRYEINLLLVITGDVKVALFNANKRPTRPCRGTCRFVAETKGGAESLSQEASRVSIVEMMDPTGSCRASGARLQCGLTAAWTVTGAGPV